MGIPSAEGRTGQRMPIRGYAMRMAQNTIVMTLSIALGLFLMEVILRIDGRYHDLASQPRDLVYSPAIWERPVDMVAFKKHPDVNALIEIRTDSDGVRNHSEIPTDRKRNIIGFFGDSFVENRRIEDRFSFTSILDTAAGPEARVVNYGVDGYGLDQSYLRYQKYQKHDIKHVVYVFCENDLRNLYETGLTEVAQNGDIIIRAAKVNLFYHAIGRIHLTYLILEAYYKVTAFLNLVGSSDVSPIDWFDDAKSHRGRFRYANAVTLDFLSATPSDDVLQLARKFLLLLKKWKLEVEGANRTFTVLILPRKSDADLAAKLFHDFDGNVIGLSRYFENYDNFAFEHDGHWNEYGNVKAAEVIFNNQDFPFHDELKSMDFIGKLKIELDEYYRKHR
jgi:hypothetical protein